MRSFIRIVRKRGRALGIDPSWKINSVPEGRRHLYVYLVLFLIALLGGTIKSFWR
jgi:hypothetical protein